MAAFPRELPEVTSLRGRVSSFHVDPEMCLSLYRGGGGLGVTLRRGDTQDPGGLVSPG